MNKIFELKFGSHLYGTNTENSDLDLKSIYLPTAQEICLNSYRRTITTSRPKKEFERNNKDDVDIEIFSLDRYIELLLEGQTVALDILFSGKEMYTYSNPDTVWIIEELYKNRHEFLHSNINAFIGYAKAQAARYGLKGFRVHALRTVLDLFEAWKDKAIKVGDCDLEHWVPNCGNKYITIEYIKNPKGILEPYLNVCDKKIAFNSTVKWALQHTKKRVEEYGHRALLAERNEGIDYKACSHAVRVNSQAIELLTTSNIMFPRPDKELLLDIKTGKLPYKEIADIIEKGLEDLKIAEVNSILRKEPNKEWTNDFIFKVYSDIVKGNL